MGRPAPRTIAAERISSYIDSNYEPHIVSFEHGATEFVQRQIFEQSPAAGESLVDIQIPQGLLVAAVLRDGNAIIPRGDHRLEVGDDVVLFVRRSEIGMVQLFFPSPEAG